MQRRTPVLSRRKARVLVAGLVAAAATTACGTTVHVDGGRIGGGLESGEAARPGDALPGTEQTSTTGGARPDQPGYTPPGQPGGGEPAAPSVARPTPPDATTLRNFTDPRHGVTKTTITIGYTTARDLSTTATALGISGADTGDMDAQVAAIAAYLNRRGGLHGRRIVLVNHDFKTAQAAQDPATSDQAACATFTEDNKVFAVLDTIAGGGQGFRDCLAKTGTALIEDFGGSADNDARNFSRPLGPFSAGAMSYDRYLPGLVDRMIAQRFFAKWDIVQGDPGSMPVKIGLTYRDETQGHHYARMLRAGLARRGMKIEKEIALSTDLSQLPAQTHNAVLSFKAAGITHIFNANLYFYEDAETQRYFPRYAVDDAVATPALLAEILSSQGSEQLHGALGAGYRPNDEVPNPPDVSPATTLCRKIMNDAGEDTSKQFTRQVMYTECDDFFLLAAGLRVGGALTAAALRFGVESLGETFQPAVTYSPARFGPGQHDGANRIRDFAYSDSCGCFQFTSTKTYPV